MLSVWDLCWPLSEVVADLLANLQKPHLQNSYWKQQAPKCRTRSWRPFRTLDFILTSDFGEDFLYSDSVYIRSVPQMGQYINEAWYEIWKIKSCIENMIYQIIEGKILVYSHLQAYNNCVHISEKTNMCHKGGGAGLVSIHWYTNKPFFQSTVLFSSFLENSNKMQTKILCFWFSGCSTVQIFIRGWFTVNWQFPLLAF